MRIHFKDLDFWFFLSRAVADRPQSAERSVVCNRYTLLNVILMMGFLNPVGFVFQVLKHAMTSGLYVDVEATDNCGMFYLNYSNLLMFTV